jgi:hypothetical protein
VNSNSASRIATYHRQQIQRQEDINLTDGSDVLLYPAVSVFAQTQVVPRYRSNRIATQSFYLSRGLIERSCFTEKTTPLALNSIENST